MRTVKSFGQEQKATGRYETYLAKSLAKVKERIKNVALFLGAGSSLAYAALVAILWYGGRQVVNRDNRRGSNPISTLHGNRCQLSRYVGRPIYRLDDSSGSSSSGV